MEKKQNPTFHKRLCRRRDTSKSWSELPLDLLNSLFERLGFADFQRAKSVCSSWYSASRQAVPKNQIPWLILFPEYKSDNSCTLFNPEEQNKLYKTQDLGVEFRKSVCQATYGSWLLMQYPPCNLYMVNLFSHERINLPPVESQLGITKIERTSDDWFCISNDRKPSKRKCIIDIRSPVFWNDEKTKDYVVIWGLERCCVVYAKKGDTSWNQIPETSDCLHMVYKDHKLYFLSSIRSFKILDFSEDISQQTFQVGKLLRSRFHESLYVVARKLVVTVTGDVLYVERMIRCGSRFQSFSVSKIYSSGFVKKYEKVDSLGDEAMLFDLGITVLANKVEGLNRNSIYFSGSRETDTKDIVIFNLETQKMERLHKFDCSLRRLFRARWFLPSFTQI